MDISDIRIKLVNKSDSKVKAFASFTIDDAFIVHDVRVVENDSKLFVSMPSKRGNDGEHIDIAHPKNTQTREQIKQEILNAYEKAVADNENK